jgi:hypothetical protein
MSTFLISAFLALANGRKDTSLKFVRSGKEIRIQHTIYDTSLQCFDATVASAQLRVYSSSSDVVLPDDTVAYVVAKAWPSPNDGVVLEPSN